VWNKYDTLVPHPAYIYFIKMPANPDNPSRFVFFPPTEKALEQAVLLVYNFHERKNLFSNNFYHAPFA
jgi:hypothetical protein